MVIPSRQLVELVDPRTARVASMLRSVVGQPAVVVERFELHDDGVVLRATPDELDAVLEQLRSYANEQPELVLARFSRKLRDAFHT